MTDDCPAMSQHQLEQYPSAKVTAPYASQRLLRSCAGQVPALGHLPIHSNEFVHARGAGRLGRLAELAQMDSFITRVLGTDCYTAALAAVNGDCRSLGHEQKTRLALAFANCHLHKLGKRTYACTGRMSLQQCVDHDDTVCPSVHSLLPSQSDALGAHRMLIISEACPGTQEFFITHMQFFAEVDRYVHRDKPGVIGPRPTLNWTSA